MINILTFKIKSNHKSIKIIKLIINYSFARFLKRNNKMKKRDQKSKDKGQSDSIGDEQLAAILSKIKESKNDKNQPDYEEIDYSDNEEGEFEMNEEEYGEQEIMEE